jgi:cyclopropane-fatty-acyl-phospholipid synthase
MYSCALWSEAEGGVRGDLECGPTPGDLEAAQLRKIHHVLRKARVKPGHRILEFGSGWGGLAIEVGVYFMQLVELGTDILPRLPVTLAVKSIP